MGGRSMIPPLLGAVPALLATACGGAITPGPQFLGSGNPALDFRVPVTPLEDRRYATVIRQRYDFSCGSAALATLLRYHYGLDATEESVFRGMWANGDQAQIKRVGFSLLDMKRYLGAQELSANGYKVPLDKIQTTGLPGIALLQLRDYRHFVVVKGVNDAEVLVGDPSLGLRVMSRNDFLAAWNGVYFVIGSVPSAEPVFNSGVQWASYARAPVGVGFDDPLSQQALLLTAPFPGDF